MQISTVVKGLRRVNVTRFSLDLSEPEGLVSDGPEDQWFPAAAENVYDRFDQAMVTFLSNRYSSTALLQYTGW